MANRTYHASEINYSGRTSDILLLQFIQSPVADAVVKPDISNVPRMTTGIEKMVQRFALIFLTQLGTVKNRESEGTEILNLIGLGRIYDENTLRAAASIANKETQSQIRREDAALTTADDEALASSEVVDLGLDRATATITITIKLTSVAGETYTFITPVETGF